MAECGTIESCEIGLLGLGDPLRIDGKEAVGDGERVGGVGATFVQLWVTSACSVAVFETISSSASMRAWSVSFRVHLANASRSKPSCSLIQCVLCVLCMSCLLLRPLLAQLPAGIHFASRNSLTQLPSLSISRTSIWRDPIITTAKPRKSLPTISSFTVVPVI